MTGKERVHASALQKPQKASSRMKRVRQMDTDIEIALCRALRRIGVRPRTQVQVLDHPRRTADVAFSRLGVAVFVDGCFWHGCRAHATWPKQNAEFWRAKIEANMARDRDTNERLRAAGWKVIRVWAHEEPTIAAGRIARILKRRRERMAGA